MSYLQGDDLGGVMDKAILLCKNGSSRVMDLEKSVAKQFSGTHERILDDYTGINKVAGAPKLSIGGVLYKLWGVKYGVAEDGSCTRARVFVEDES